MMILNNTFLLIVSTIVAFFMATMMIVMRLRAAERPTNVKKLILPPLMMSTGALMFIFPMFRVQPFEILEAAIVGIVFSIFLIKSTKFKVVENEIYLIPSRAFIFILVGLLVARTIYKLIIGSTITFGETSGMFFLLGFFMIITWRTAMLVKYFALRNKINDCP